MDRVITNLAICPIQTTVKCVKKGRVQRENAGPPSWQCVATWAELLVDVKR